MARLLLVEDDREGVELVARLRRRGMGAPVLVLTARGTLADRVEGLDAGAEDYLVKPFEVDELLARVFTDAGTPGSVDTYVHHLRRKLGREVVATVPVPWRPPALSRAGGGGRGAARRPGHGRG